MKDFEISQQDKSSIYRKVFGQAKDIIFKSFAELKPNFKCKNCENFKAKCEFYTDTPVEELPSYCVFRGWQRACLSVLKDEISKDIYDKILEMQGQKKQYSCVGCAVCCKLASSEFSYEELLEKAKSGDRFATQFTSVFKPYDDCLLAREFYPEYFDYMVEKFGKNGTNFYYCPKCDEQNRCSDYENRPEMCREFPSNPLVILPKSCGYRVWQQEAEILALTLHALSEIVDFYVVKIGEKLDV